MGYILSIDQGTTGSTALLVNEKTFEVVGKKNTEFPQIYPQPGWVEHNLNDIWNSVKESVSSVLSENNINPKDIKSIGITNQRETICPFNTKGEQLHNAIVWQDRRTSEFCNSNKDKEDFLKKKTGLPLDPYFSGTKLKWLIENSKDIQTALNSNDLRVGTIDTFLLYKLTSGESYFTEGTNASRTLLMDIQSGKWCSELGDFLNIDINILPDIKNSFDDFGKTKGIDFLPDGIPINCMLGDQQAALIGQAGFKKGDIKCTYGTGSFIVMNTGEDLIYSPNGILTTVAYRYNNKDVYALEGSCYIAGAAVQWLRDNLKIIGSAPEVEKLALEIKDLEQVKNVLLLPFFTGIGSPYWRADAKAALVGLTRDSGNAHIARATLEGMAYSINDILRVKEKDSNNKLKELRVDGGAVANNLLMQIQANISKLNIIRPKVIETTAYGSALGAIIGLGQMSFEDITNLWKEDRVFSPEEDVQYYEKKQAYWDETIKKLYLD